MMKEYKYSRSIDVLRCVGVICVVFSHIVGWYIPHYNLESYIYKFVINFGIKPFQLFQNSGHLGVALFFLVTGYLTLPAIKSRQKGKYLWGRIFRLGIPLVGAFLMTYFISVLSLKVGLDLPLGTDSANKIDYLRNLFFLNYILNDVSVLGVTWTLFVDVIFYCMIGWFYRVLKSNPLCGIRRMALCTSILIVMTFNIDRIRIAYFLPYVYIIILGMILYELDWTENHKRELVVLGIIIGMIYYVLQSYITPSLFSGKYSAIITYVYALLIFISWVPSITEKQDSDMNFLWGGIRSVASISYEIYLIHLPVGCLVMNILKKFNVPSDFIIIVATVVVLIVAYLLYKVSCMIKKCLTLKRYLGRKEKVVKGNYQNKGR